MSLQGLGRHPKVFQGHSITSRGGVNGIQALLKIPRFPESFGPPSPVGDLPGVPEGPAKAEEAWKGGCSRLEVGVPRGLHPQSGKIGKITEGYGSPRTALKALARLRQNFYGFPTIASKRF